MPHYQKMSKKVLNLKYSKHFYYPPKMFATDFEFLIGKDFKAFLLIQLLVKTIFWETLQHKTRATRKHHPA